LLADRPHAHPYQEDLTVTDRQGWTPVSLADDEEGDDEEDEDDDE